MYAMLEFTMISGLKQVLYPQSEGLNGHDLHLNAIKTGIENAIRNNLSGVDLKKHTILVETELLTNNLQVRVSVESDEHIDTRLNATLDRLQSEERELERIVLAHLWSPYIKQFVFSNITGITIDKNNSTLDVFRLRESGDKDDDEGTLAALSKDSEQRPFEDDEFLGTRPFFPANWQISVFTGQLTFTKKGLSFYRNRTMRNLYVGK